MPSAVALVGLLAVGAAKPEDRRSATIVAVVQAETDFASAAAERGIKDAFLEFIAPDGIVVRPLPVPGRAWFESHPAPAGMLAWRPDYADGARAGDLGWTTGPWSWRASASDTAVAHGHYVTVWKRQGDGTYRFAIDAGNNHPPGGQVRRVGFPAVPGTYRGVKPEGERRRLLAGDRALAKQGTLEGQAQAILENATDDIHVMRANARPAIGRPVAKVLLADRTGPLEVRPLGADVSASGDLGYTYGLSLTGQGAVRDTNTYLRIWRRARNGRWNVALDLDVPVVRRAS